LSCVRHDSVPGWVAVAHTCNPSDSGGRDQEDRGSKPAQANSSGDPTSKIGLVEWLKEKVLSNTYTHTHTHTHTHTKTVFLTVTLQPDK
jgi:hypothetical protein